MSDPTVSSLLTRLLCSRGGRLPRSLLPTLLNLSTKQIEKILKDESQKFPLAEEMVLARSPIRTCTKYMENIPEEECDKLHLCRHYLQGACKRQWCPFSHDVFSDHNWTVLEANEISGLNEVEIKILLLQNDNQLLPEVCEKYLGDSCDLGEDCSRLHICGSFLRGECDGGDCGRSHHLLEFASDLLLSHCHIPELSIKNFQTLCTVRHNERLQEKQKYKEGTPTALSGPRKRKNSADGSQNQCHGRQQEKTESNSQRVSDSRPMPGNEVIRLPSTEDDDQKPVKMFIVQDLKSPEPPHPLPVSSPLVTDSHRSSIQSTLPVTLPKVSSVPHNECALIPRMVPDNESRMSPTGLPAGLSSASQSPSAPQPKPTTTPVTTDRPDNASPVPMDAPSVSKQKTDPPFDELLAPFLVVNSSPVPPTQVTSPVELVDSLTKGPSVAQPKPTTRPVTTDRPANASPVNVPLDAPSVFKAKPVVPFNEPLAPFHVVDSSTVPAMLVTSPVGLVDSFTKGPSAAQPKPTTILVTTDGPEIASLVPMDTPSVSKQKTVAPFHEPVAPFLVVNSSTVPTLVTSPVGLIDSLTKGPSAAQPKPITTPVTTDRPANVSPVNVPMDAPSVSEAKPVVPFDPAAPFLVVNSSTVPPMLVTSPVGLVDSFTKGPSASQPKPTTTTVTTDRPGIASLVPMDAPSVSKQKTVAPFDESVAPFLVVNSSTVPPTLVTSPVELVDSLTEGPSAAQPKPTTIPVTTDRPTNASPVNFPLDAPSVSKAKPVVPFDPAAPFLVVDSSTVPPTLFIGSVGLTDYGPSTSQENPVNSPFVSPDSAQPVVTPITLVTSPIASSASTPSTSDPRLVNSFIFSWVPSVPQENPVTTNIASPNVPTIKPVSFPAASPSSATPMPDPNLFNSPTKSNLFFLDKPVNPTILSPYTVVTPIKPATSTVASPSTAPSTLHLVPHQPLHQLTTMDIFPTKAPFLPLENPIQSSVQSQPPCRPVVTNPGMTSWLPLSKIKSQDSDKVPEICLSNLWKYCKLEGRCPDMHYYLPYRWQIYKGTNWEDISNMEEIEIWYCVPVVDRVQSIDFVTMRSGDHRVRRLSTVSSVTKPPEYVLTTEWLWYWKDEYGAWRQYGHYNVQTVSATASSSDLENVYIADPTAVLPFTAGNHLYEIHFQEMKQKNVLYKTEKDVRRRPKYLSFEDVTLLKGRTKSSALPPLKTIIYPRTWDVSALPEIGCKKVPVSDTSSEFSEIVGSFTKTVSGYVVRSISRLQNPFLWQLFQWQKEHMRQVNQGRDVKELRLFHGTGATHIDAICNQNFDWRICGTRGTVYGQGSYFARDASYSHSYATPMFSGIRMMFIARVLVGDYVLGNPQMKRPPLRPGSTTRYYDSCVDNITNPSIFVVFEKHQIYPEYLLGYEQQKKS